MTCTNINGKEIGIVQFAHYSEEQCRRIHDASLEILERVGVRLYLQEAIDILKKAGANVTDSNLVHVPSGLVEKAFTTVPRQLVLYDRHGSPAMPLESNRCFYGPGSDCLNIIDHRTGERRKPVLKDVEAGTILCDALPNIDFVMSMVIPSDVDQTIADRYQMKAMLSHTTKPIIFVTYEFGGCLKAVEMAEIVAGGEEALRKTPSVACYINVVSGLCHNKEALQKLLFLSGKGLPLLYIPVSTSGITSPVTGAGAVALDNAGVLVGLVLSQLKREGAPFVTTGLPPSMIDMHTLVTVYCNPDRGIFQAMGHFYNLPMFALGGVTDSKVVDQQAAAEAALTLMTESLSGGNIIHDLGYLESGLTFSFAQLVICDEITSWLKAFFKGGEISDETLALDFISQLGPHGNYLETSHTLKHHRGCWYPNLFDRATYEAWVKKGSKTLGERAVDRVEQILSEHQPESLSDDIKKQFVDILQHV